MSRSNPQVLIELDGPRVTIAQPGSSGAGGLRRVAVASRPDETDPGEARSVGAWVASAMADAGIKARGRAVVALPRNEAMLKRLEVRVPADAGPADVDGAVRMQMARQLQASMETGRIDYRILVDEPTGEGTRRIVAIAGALPNERLEFVREMTRAAGLGLARVTLRTFGAVAQLATEPTLSDGAVIAIALGPASSEIVLLEDGVFLAARGIDVARPQEPEGESAAAVGRRLAVEVKRTWASYRAGPESREVTGVVVLGDDPVAAALASAAAQPLSVEGRAVGRVEARAGGGGDPVSDHERALAIPLSGLTLGGAAETALDFEHPAAPPPKGVRRRQLALVAVLGLILVGGGGYLVADHRLAELEGRVDAARQDRDRLGQEYLTYLTRRAREEHLRAWLGGNPRWIDHLDWIVGRVPDPPAVLLDEIKGSEDGAGTGIVFAPSQNDQSELGGQWVRQRRVLWDLSGRVRDPDALASLRAALLEGGLVRVRTQGPDEGAGFGLTLSTTLERLNAAGAQGPDSGDAETRADASLGSDEP